jgi:LmbE family N-acetylglucosaminyl deacetylase
MRWWGYLVVVACACVALAVASERPDGVVLPPLALSDQARVLVFAPHPDDETIAVGGLIHRLTHDRVRVDVVFVTNGDGYRDALGPVRHLGKPNGNDFIDLGKRRWREALEATHRLGVHRKQVHFLGFPDGGLAELWQAHWAQPYTSPYTVQDHPPYPDAEDPGLDYEGMDLTSIMAHLIRRLRPTVIVMPHPSDTHLDHAHTSYFVTEALDTLRADGRLDPDPQVLTFLVHDYTWPPALGIPVDMPAPPAERYGDTAWLETRLSPADLAAKKSALAAYETQLAVMPDLLHKFMRPNELFGRPDPDVLVRIAARHQFR